MKWLGEVFRCLVTIDEHRKQYIDNGRLRFADVPNVFPDVYPVALFPALMDLLMATGVVYPARGFSTSSDPCFIVPYLLPTTPPSAPGELMAHRDDSEPKQVRCFSMLLSIVGCAQPVHTLAASDSVVRTG